ncbi:hypothetical protein CPC08DRAFT_649697 [Agrocybe pediades]|nr:hypothetical protein CPC08DRAFT_649697 [Agrocybe pediades]
MALIQDHTQFFARIHVHGLTSENGERSPITLERHISFPPPVEVSGHDCPDLKVIDIDLSPRTLDPVFDLTARVRFDSPQPKGQNIEWNPSNPKNALGYGRSGLVFPLEVLSISPSNDPRAADLMAQLPPLCIKVATPGYARSLAREAWFYEHLDAKGLTGVITPRCYGVFHAALGTSRSNTDLKVDIPNYNYYSIAKRPIWEHTLHYTAPLSEEHYDSKNNTLALSRYFADDRKCSYKSSPWRLFSQSPKVTTLTVLVMDLLGEPMTVKGFEEEWDGDVQDMYDDLARAFILHQDGRFPNVLRVPNHAQRHCESHLRAHKWNFIDWENANLQCDTVTTRHRLRTQALDISDYSSSVGGVYGRLRGWI